MAVVLFSVGGFFALYEGFHKVSHPEPIDSWQWVPILVLVVALGLEGFSFRTAIVESNQVRGKQTWTQFIRRAKAPELPVVLLEDFAALIGLGLALFGVGLTLITDDGVWDGIGTLAIGVLLVTVAIVLAVETKSLLLGEAASPTDEAAIRQRWRPTTRSSDSSTCAPCTWDPTSCWSPPRSRCAATTRRPRCPRPSMPRRRASARPAHRHGDLCRARHRHRQSR